MPSPAPSPIPCVLDEIKNILEQVLEDKENCKNDLQ